MADLLAAISSSEHARSGILRSGAGVICRMVVVVPRVWPTRERLRDGCGMVFRCARPRCHASRLARRSHRRPTGQQCDQGNGRDPTKRTHRLSIPPRSLKATAHKTARLNRNALPMTDTELNVMAALAIIGLSNNPKNGYNTPAAIGTPMTL